MFWKNKSITNLISNNCSNDPIEIIREKVREIVAIGYDKGWEGPPFDPIKLAQILGYKVMPNEEIPDARIFELKKKNSFQIEYNPNQRESRINFSIAHEIGHTLFDDCGEMIRNREDVIDKENREIEFLCNVAASEILLPYNVFSNEINSIDLSIDNLLQIANKYKASVESVLLRVCEVVNKQCAMIIATFSNDEKSRLVVDYFKSSKALDLTIKNGDCIPLSSKSYDCLNSGWTSYGVESWEIADNRYYEVFSIGLPPVKRSNVKRVGLLLVPKTNTNIIEQKSIQYVNGDATQPRGLGNKIIAQVINTSGGLGFGFGKAMSLKWPESKRTITSWIQEKNDFILGNTRLTKLNSETYVLQMIAQKGIFQKGDIIPLRYDSLRKCILDLAYYAKEHSASIHMPKIGAGQAGGDWGIIEGMIYEILINQDIDVTIYILPGAKIKEPLKSKTQLTLFE